MHTATEAHQAYHPDHESELFDQRLLYSGQPPERNCASFWSKDCQWVNRNPQRDWSEYSRSLMLNTPDSRFHVPRYQRSNSGTKFKEDDKIWVGGLPNDTDDVSIHQLFENYGSIAKVKIVHGSDQHNQRSHTFAFVT